MKKISILLAACMTLFITSSSFAQYGGMGMGGMRGGMGMGGMDYAPSGQSMQAPQKSFEANFIGAAGYFDFEIEEALKKLKIEEASEKGDAVVKVISDFIKSSQELIITNREEIDILEFANESIKAAGENIIEIRELASDIKRSMSIIKPKMIIKHEELNSQMTKVLSSKELRRWAKFYKSTCRHNKFDPKAKDDKEEEEEDNPRNRGGRPQR